MTQQDDQLMTVSQVATESGFSKETIWRHIYKGALPVIRIGPYRRPRVRRSDFRVYMGEGDRSDSIHS